MACTKPGCFPYCDCGGIDDYVPPAATPSEDGREVPQVVGYYSRMRSVLDASGWVNTIGAHKSKETHLYDWQRPVMTVAQHERIVAAKDAAHRVTLDELHALEVTVAKAGQELDAKPARRVIPLELLERVCSPRNEATGWAASADAISELRALLGK